MDDELMLVSAGLPPGADLLTELPSRRRKAVPSARSADRPAAEGMAPADAPDRPFALIGLGLDEPPADLLEARGPGERVGQREGDPVRQVGAAGQGRERLASETPRARAPSCCRKSSSPPSAS